MPVNAVPSSEHAQLIHWLQQDELRMHALHSALKIASEHKLDHWLLAAGFVRNLVWDKLHGFEGARLSDIDFIYFCQQDMSPERDKYIEASLRGLSPDLPWSVKNQARMHNKNADKPYLSINDAMGHWPEKETALGVRLESNLLSFEFHLESAFGLASLFALKLSHNPKRELSVFRQRVEKKCWLEYYPKLTVIPAIKPKQP